MSHFLPICQLMDDYACEFITAFQIITKNTLKMKQFRAFFGCDLARTHSEKLTCTNMLNGQNVSSSPSLLYF